MRRKSRKNAVLFLLFFVFFGFFATNFITSDHFHVLHLYLYKANEFFLPYYHKADKNMPDVDYADFSFNNSRDGLLNGARDLSTTNFLCLIPEIKYDNKLAMRYLAADFKALNKTFYQCDQPEREIDLVEIADYTLFDVETRKLNSELYHMLKEQKVIEKEVGEYKYVEYYSLRLNARGFKAFYNQDADDIKCYAQRFQKAFNQSEHNEGLELIGKMRIFEEKHNFTLYFDTHGLYFVNCYKSFFGSFKSYEYVYNVYPRDMNILRDERLKFKKHEDEKRGLVDEKPEHVLFSSEKEEVKIEKKMNVLILAFDSLSYNHFKRVFPVTFDYLSSKLDHTVVYESLSSVGGNTFPNILSLMAGIVETGVDAANVSSEMSRYRSIDGSYFDYMPFIWHEFEKLGYITAFQEDLPEFAIFNYLKDGFRYQPTAFYGRPYWVKYYKTRSGGFSMCHQGRPTYKTYFNLVESFVSQMNRKENSAKPFFSFNFLTEYTHDFLASPPQLDTYTTEVLRRMEYNGYLDNTLLILTSDHGNRLQSFAYGTEIGKIEKFLPFFSIRLPRQLWNTTYEANLKANKKKLVGFYDVYQTLRQFLHLNSNFSKPPDRSQYRVNSRETRFLRGTSLFEQIPMNRSCADVLIPEEQCRCFKQYMISEVEFQKDTSKDFNDAVDLILNSVNALSDSVRDRCIEFKKEKIQSAKPGDAWFESSIKIDGERNLAIHGGINRISAYGNQSLCVDTSFMRNYCFCK